MSRDALARLPVTRKSELLDLQKAARPFGGFAATRWGDMRRVFASPGPIYEPEGEQPDYWRLARALFAAGFRAGDLVHNCFSYHLTPAGSMLETGAHALGCTVVPGGTGQTELQVQAMADLRPVGYVGTPSFLKIILEKADELRTALAVIAACAAVGRGVPAEPARCAGRARHRGLSGVRDGGPGRDRVRIAGARRPDRRRRGAGRDRAAGHRRPGSRRRGRRGRRHGARERRLPADPLRHGRPVGAPAGPLAVRTLEHADQGMDGARGPDDEGQGHVRPSRAGRGDRAAARRRSAARASSSTTRKATTG